MALLAGISGFAFAGSIGLLLALATIAIITATGSRVGAQLVLRAYKAQPLNPRNAPDLVQLFTVLSQRAGLSQPPGLFYVPSPMMNAFAVGQGDGAAIAVTDGLLQRLNPRELSGVLAHELSHVRHQDIYIMGLADAFSRVTATLGQIGQLLIVLSLPALALGWDFPYAGALVLLLAPGVSALLQLALSRSREFHADLGAVDITGDPAGLASALAKIERIQASWLERVLLPGRREQQPALLRTHPHTDERIERLKQIAADPPASTLLNPRQLLVRNVAPTRQRPRWHWNGTWY
ncbi:MAG: zinc metalloprotease HtpX [Pseudomonadota bacterium]